jgi:hypothetical protein
MTTRKSTPSRTRRARETATLGPLQRKVEDMLGIPHGSVRFEFPSGRKARIDSKVGTLRSSWEE